jgi:putative heavy-metal-binding protein
VNTGLKAGGTAMLVTTTPGIEGHTVTQYLGVVTAQGVLGVNVFKDIGAGVRNIFGGRARSYENELASGVSDALAEMESRRPTWARMRWSGSTSTTSRWGQHADGQRLRDGGEVGLTAKGRAKARMACKRSWVVSG